MSLIRWLLCAAVLAASTRAAFVAPPNIILITVDTTRADRMGFMGSKLGLTPNLDKLARDSVVFTRAYCQAPLTAPSHATILTGTYPQFHHVGNFGVMLAQDLPYAPAILKAGGYRTAAFVGALVLDPESLAPGFGRGFDTYDAGFGHPTPGADRYHTFERRAGEVVANALAWLDKIGLNKNHDSLKQPRADSFFLWVHLYDPHDPYEPPEPYKTRYASAPYDGEIAYADSAVGKFLEELRTRGIYNGAVIAVMADHGEALGDHGEETHGFFLYDETIHVPLLIKLPDANSGEKQSAGKRVETRVELVDVLPTILQAAGIAVPREVQGESLLALMTSPAESAAASPSSPAFEDRQAYAETDYGHQAYGWASLQSLRTGKYLYVKAPRQELYDQSVDPNAEHDLSAASTAVASTLAERLEAFRQKTSSSREAPKASVNPEARQKLAALGYVASDPSSNRSPDSRVSMSGRGADAQNLEPQGPDRGADPKDKIEIANLIHRVNMLRGQGNCRGAVPLLRQVIAKDPSLPELYSKLGQCLMLMNDYPQAVPPLRKVVELVPESADAHFQLGAALVAIQDFKGAVPELEYAVVKLPRWERARLVLANAYAHTDRLPEAIKQYRDVLEDSPDDYLANLLLGRVLLRSGDAASAVPKLKKAAELQPKASEPHAALSDAYLNLGRNEEAAQEQAEAQRLAAK